MIKKIFLYLFLIWLIWGYFIATATATAEHGAVDCDPIVSLDVQPTTLQKVLSLLAEQYHFDLIFPVDADRSVEQIDAMSLSQSLKYLTADVNTILQHEKVEGCARGRLISLEVLPVGQDAEYVYVKPAEYISTPNEPQVEPQIEPQIEPQVDSDFIDDMELYAEEILLNKRKMDKVLLPEQRQEFRETMRQVRTRLEAEGLLESGNQMHNRNNNVNSRRNNNSDTQE